jgi:hypothetical protein
VDTGDWKEAAKMRMGVLLDEIVFEGVSCGGSIALQQQSVKIAVSLPTRRDTNSYPKEIAYAEWFFSRGERLLLAATATTSIMPGGIDGLIHG